MWKKIIIERNYIQEDSIDFWLWTMTLKIIILQSYLIILVKDMKKVKVHFWSFLRFVSFGCQIWNSNHELTLSLVSLCWQGLNKWPRWLSRPMLNNNQVEIISEVPFIFFYEHTYNFHSRKHCTVQRVQKMNTIRNKLFLVYKPNT